MPEPPFNKVTDLLSEIQENFAKGFFKNTFFAGHLLATASNI